MISAAVVPLNKGHDVSSFCSGDDNLDRWLHRSAKPMGGSGLNRTHLWVDGSEGTILGYFALAPTIVTTNALIDETAPSILLAKMALCEERRFQSPPVGPELLLAAIETVVTAAELIGGRFLAVDTQHDRAFRFYERNQFVPIEGGEGRLIIKMSALRGLLA